MYKGRLLVKKIALLLTLVFLASTVVIPEGSVAAADFNYGEALQKAIMFYEFQRSGKLPADNRINWRGDSGLTDGADVGLDLTGGWYDAGDHIKFNLPMAYTVSMLAWSVYESRDAYVKSGQLSYMLSSIKWASDYLIKCHPSPNVYYYQVGSVNDDHKWWGPCEVMQMPRPAYKVDSSNPGSSVAGESAAALAAVSAIFKDSDPTYAATCLRHAKELFTFADTTRSDKGYTAAAGCYDVNSGYVDELTWASIWIYIATNDKTYLDKAESFEPLWQREQQSTTIKYKWGQCWDDNLMGCLLLLAKLTDKPLYKECIERHLDWWSTGVDGQRIAYTAKGLAWLFQWGSLRHASTTAFLASVYANWSGCTPSKVKAYKDFAKSQIDYCLGSTGRSFVTGFGVNPPQHYHHRTAQGSWYDNMKVPENHRHTLIGALVGGPKSSSDGSYSDQVDDYQSNEVACDYNAGFVGALANLYGEYGGTPIPNLKAIEPVPEDEIYVEAALNNKSSNHIEVRAYLINKSAWPARVGDKLSFKYFVDISEAIDAGYKASDLTVSTGYTQGGTASQLIPWDASKNIYYTNVDFTGTKIYPGGQSAYRHEVQFRISAPLGTSFWDNSNDFSFDGISPDSNSAVKVSNMPVYDAGVKVFGQEPGGGTSPSPSVTPVPTPTSSQTTGFKVSGDVRVAFSYSNPAVLKGFKVEIPGTQISATTDENGHFSLVNVPKNSSGYTVGISKSGYLYREIKDIAISDHNVILGSASSPLNLLPGDIDGNGAINMSDIIEMAQSFNKVNTDPLFDSTVDFNGDSAINMNDIMIVAAYFNKTASDYPEAPVIPDVVLP